MKIDEGRATVLKPNATKLGFDKEMDDMNKNYDQVAEVAEYMTAG